MPYRPKHKKKPWIVSRKPFDHSKGWEQNPFYSKQRWRRLRLIKLNKNPLCEKCSTIRRPIPATEVDHIIPVRIDINKGFDMDNLQSLCKICHSIKSGKDSTLYGKTNNKKY